MLLDNDIEICEKTSLERTGMTGSTWKAGVEREIHPAMQLPLIPVLPKIPVVLITRRYCSCLDSVFALRHRLSREVHHVTRNIIVTGRGKHRSRLLPDSFLSTKSNLT
jgi:hypothetical protein